MVRLSFLLALARAAVAGAVLFGCSAEDGEQDCTDQAAFELTLRSALGPLPHDTEVLVEYSGGEEPYFLSKPNDNEIVLCQATHGGAQADAGDAGGASDAGDAGALGPVTTLTCKLWTQGPATVTVKAPGFDDVVRKPAAEKRNGCFETVPVEVVLGEVDAGP